MLHPLVKHVSAMEPVVVAAFYRFVTISDTELLQRSLLDVLTVHELKGTILVAEEGINGTVAGSRTGIDALKQWLQQDGRFDTLSFKESSTGEIPFRRARVKLKKEIVSMGCDSIDPNRIVGTYVDPSEWNNLISNPDVVLIDARNDYEVQIGTFRGAINPHTDSFRDLPRFLDDSLASPESQKVAMFCTGGIRCEKSTAYLKENGFSHVYHLKGGILNYLENIPESESMWEGECFVFDERVSVDHSLKKGSYHLCRACRMPLSQEEMEHPDFIPGISCPHCVDIKSEDDRKRYREREKQVVLARERGMAHLGSTTPESSQIRSEPETSPHPAGGQQIP